MKYWEEDGYAEHLARRRKRFGDAAAGFIFEARDGWKDSDNKQKRLVIKLIIEKAREYYRPRSRKREFERIAQPPRQQVSIREKIIRKIEMLSLMTVSNGCTTAEAENAARKIAILRKKLSFLSGERP